MNRLLFVFALCICYASAYPTWEEYKMKYNLNGRYSPDEENARMIHYANNLKNIAAHNYRYDNGLETYRQDVNQFTHMSYEEVQDTVLLKTSFYSPADIEELRLKAINKAIKPEPVVTKDLRAPAYLNWDESGHVSGVKDQGQCGSCWAFSTSTCAESRNAIKKGLTFNNGITFLSEQQLVDCTSNATVSTSNAYVNYGCLGGWTDHAFKYMQQVGLSHRHNYAPYAQKELGCDHAAASTFDLKVVAVNSKTDAKDVDLINALQSGPVTVGLFAERSFIDYKSGIYQSSTCTTYTTVLLFLKTCNANHAVVVVGYKLDAAGKVEYWVVRNSWNANWGEAGHIRVKGDLNMCCINSKVVWPDV